MSLTWQCSSKNSPEDGMKIKPSCLRLNIQKTYSVAMKFKQKANIYVEWKTNKQNDHVVEYSGITLRFQKHIKNMSK